MPWWQLAILFLKHQKHLKDYFEEKEVQKYYSIERITSWNLVGSYFWGPNAQYTLSPPLSLSIIGKEKEIRP